VHKINGTSGAVIWRLNGKRSDFAMGEGSEFCFQHHARWLEQQGDGDGIEVISLYDNSAHGTEHGGGKEVHTAEESSGKVLRLDTNKWTAELVQGYYPPKGYKLLSKSQGSTQVLPGGNVLVNWGSEGAVTEYTAEGEVVFHAEMDSGKLGVGVENYRAFKFSWTGLPSEEPAVVALEGEDGETTIYVSWNGDTETAVWRFFEVVDGFGSRSFLGEAKRKSFETKLVLPEGKKVKKVAAEAVDKRGRVLRVTGEVGVEPEILPAQSVKTKSGTSGQSPVDGQEVLGTGPSAKSRWEEYAVLKFFRLAKDL
jgi:hypothetical protein